VRKHDTLEQVGAGFSVITTIAWRYVNHTIGQLAAFAPTLTQALTSHHAGGYLLLDGTVAESDRVQTPEHFSGKARREGVNLQVITAEEKRGGCCGFRPPCPAAPTTSPPPVTTASSTPAHSWTSRSSRTRATKEPAAP
jgi:hypothetical protein